MEREVSYICVDNRTTTSTGQTIVLLDNGQRVPLPVHITSVPSLDRFANQRYTTTVGLKIKTALDPNYTAAPANAVSEVAAPVGVQPAVQGGSLGSKYNSDIEEFKIKALPLDYTPGQDKVREGDDSVAKLIKARAEIP